MGTSFCGFLCPINNAKIRLRSRARVEHECIALWAVLNCGYE
jgi:hypothetical protein